MVEATSATADANQTTPESEKPRVQLLLSSKTTSPPVTKLISQQNSAATVNEEQKNLALLKQTVAQMDERGDGQSAASTNGTA